MASASESIAIRRCGAEDAERLALVGAATFLETYAGMIGADDILAHCAHQNAPQRYAAWLADERYVFWLAEAQSGRAPVGFSMLSPPDLSSVATHDGDLELKRIYLLHRFHGGGHGAALMQVAIGEARARGASRMLLGVYAENARALAFYSRNGFVPIGERRFRVGVTEFHDRVLALDLIGS